MTDDEVVQQVATDYPAVPADHVQVARIEGFDQLAYVTINSGEDVPLVGGRAYVVDESDGTVYVVSASRPPRVNCAQVQRRAG